MNWYERPEVKKGNLVEKVLDRLHTDLLPDWSLYKAPDKWHRVDRLLLNNRTGRTAWCEYKGYGPRAWYPDVGLSEAKYANYKMLSTTSERPLVIYWVDTQELAAYFGDLSELEEPRSLLVRGRMLRYPLRQGGFIYFPLCGMHSISIMQPFRQEVFYPLVPEIAKRLLLARDVETGREVDTIIVEVLTEARWL